MFAGSLLRSQKEVRGMDRNLVVFAGIVVALFAGAGLISAAVSAHMSDGGYYQFNSQDPEFSEHYREMLELHKQFSNNEISLEEFEEKMFSEEFHEDGFGCHGGFGMMGPYMMMGWR
jgi:hypothetical protein